MIEDLPTKEEELERKAMDELSRILNLYDIGRITHREMNLMLDTLWECMAGLTSEEWREFIQEARRLGDDRVPFEYHALRKHPYTLISLHRSDESLSVIMRTSTGDIKRVRRIDLSDKVLPAKLARDRMKATIKEITNGGFKPLLSLYETGAIDHADSARI
ncbi:hypothetical protein R0J87_15565 [Halomonas sp. SIMBA_159]